MPPKKLVPAALGGLFIGVLSALPVVSLANCCCLWIIGGGYLAAYLMQQDYPGAITTVDGAVVGFLSGIVGALVFTLAVIPVDLVMGPLQAQLLRRILSTNGEIPPELRNLLENLATPPSSPVVASFFRLGLMLLVGVVFAPVGGILGALFSRRRPDDPARGGPQPGGRVEGPGLGTPPAPSEPPPPSEVPPTLPPGSPDL